jgi:hypothetical protein
MKADLFKEGKLVEKKCSALIKIPALKDKANKSPLSKLMGRICLIWEDTVRTCN